MIFLLQKLHSPAVDHPSKIGTKSHILTQDVSLSDGRGWNDERRRDGGPAAATTAADPFRRDWRSERGRYADGELRIGFHHRQRAVARGRGAAVQAEAEEYSETASTSASTSTNCCCRFTVRSPAPVPHGRSCCGASVAKYGDAGA